MFTLGHELRTKHKGTVGWFHLRLLLCRRWTWLRWLAYLTCLITVISYLYPETNLVRAAHGSFYRPGILRHGQYRQDIVALAVDEVADKDSAEPDKTGMVHDQRFVTILNDLWTSLL